MKTTFKELLLCNKYHKPAPLNIKNNEKCRNIFCFSNRAVWQYSFNMELSDQKKKNLKNPTSSPHSKTELNRYREQIGGCWSQGTGEGEIGERGQNVQISSF